MASNGVDLKRARDQIEIARGAKTTIDESGKNIINLGSINKALRMRMYNLAGLGNPGSKQEKQSGK